MQDIVPRKRIVYGHVQFLKHFAPYIEGIVFVPLATISQIIF